LWRYAEKATHGVDQHSAEQVVGVLPGQRVVRWRGSVPANGTWPLEHPVAASLIWTLALLAVFVPLCTLRYAR
jgi:hypothetical protein